MPGTTAAALAEPIRRLQALVGPGWTADATTDPAATLTGVHRMLTGVASSAGHVWSRTAGEWSGTGADAAAEFAATTASAIDAAADRARGMGVTVDAATHAVTGARRRLQEIVDEFEARATALEPHLDKPGVARELLTEARDALAQAIAIVEELIAELDRHATALDRPTAAPASTTPAGYQPAPSSGGTPAASSGFGSPAGFPSPGLSGGGSGFPGSGFPGSGFPGSAELAAFTRPEASETLDPAAFGDGVAVRLPDGTVVMAPNALAAGAVRHALTQLGVPYQWGGTTPGVGLDCSGLTQWAYGEAGLNIPRLAQEQDIGSAIAAGSVLPGDLAVWDGHVAMVVGDGLMVEAGDPVKLSPIRTANAGQGFQGFWRPTA